MRRLIALFLIAFATLALEITLTRLLSVITWYYLSFFAIATGLLGSTAGATSVYLQPNWFTPDRLIRSIANACLGFALAIPVSLITLTNLTFSADVSVQSFTTLLGATLACALPFYFAGIAVTATLTRVDIPIGKLYASDLAGAALGSLFVLGGLEVLDAPSLILLIGAVAASAWFVLVWDSAGSSLRRWGAFVPVGIAVLAILNAVSGVGIKPLTLKGNRIDRAGVELEKWNSYSQVMVFTRAVTPPALWGPSPVAPDLQTPAYHMMIDGDAGTTIKQFSSLDDIEPQGYDVTSMAYHIRPGGTALIIGLGGGKDAQTALLFGYRHVTGVDVNPTFVRLLQNDFARFANLADRPDVTLVAAEGRAFASESTDRYSVIQMSLIDTWAATGAGAFSLSENSLYTLEAWDTFYNRLADDGIFTVSRWYNPENLGETGRTVSLAVALLLRNGVSDPSAHIALITSQKVSTLLVSREALTPADIEKLREVAGELQFNTSILPGEPPADPTLRKIVEAKSAGELEANIAGEPLNFTPPTDETPYFFNMLRLGHIGFALRQEAGVLKGNLLATLTLMLLILILFLVALLTIVVPLRFKTAGVEPAQRAKPLWSAALYFSLIGSGFMLAEIALIQRLSVLLSHPIYALGVLLFTLIASTGVGSFLSEKLPLTRKPWIFVYPVVTAAMILILRFALSAVLARMITSPTSIKIVVAIVTIFPMGILMGLFYPTGMRLVSDLRAGETPWYWALNGIFSVLCSALAVMISIYVSVSANFYIAAGCYLAVLISLVLLYRMRAAEQPA